VPGPQVEVVGIGEDDARIQLFQPLMGSAFTLPVVPTGMNTGVGISVRRVHDAQAGAAPRSLCSSSN